MTREEIIAHIKENASCLPYLEKSKGGMYCCPFCGSGNGKNKTGAMKYYPETNTVSCFGRCEPSKGNRCKSYDVIDLDMNANGTDFNTSINNLASDLGIIMDTSIQSAPNRPIKSRKVRKSDKDSKTAEMGEKEQNEADYSAYYELCRECLEGYPEAISYLNGRGISIETAKKCGIGFDKASDPVFAPGGVGKKKHPVPRLIIPTSKSHYTGRRTDGGKEYPKMNPKDASVGIFNGDSLFNGADYVYVVEGSFDAMAIVEVGREAIALNSINNGKALIEVLTVKPTKATLILLPDNDQDEKTRADVIKKNKELSEWLTEIGIKNVVADTSGEFKDANEFLVADREGFIEMLEKAEKMAKEKKTEDINENTEEKKDQDTEPTEPKPDNTVLYLKSFMGEDMENFKGEKKTGFANLDREADGLYNGLYIMAAISSLGKTTFILQMAEQLAVNGHDVMFFSLEQTKLELMTKILARRTVTRTENGNLSFDGALSSLQIRKGEYGNSKQKVIDAMNNHIAETGGRLNIIEGGMNVEYSFIHDRVMKYIEQNHVKPVVIVDYLQIMEDSQEEQWRRHSTKEVVDSNIKNLKRLSNIGMTVIAICSVNRANYMMPIDFESIKESGSAEYGSDVVWGLQLKCLDEPLFESDKKAKEKRDRIKKAKGENPRRIKFVCLKNRYGKSSYNCAFKYYPSCDLFVPDYDEY